MYNTHITEHGDPDDEALAFIIRTLRRLRRSARWQAMHRAAYELPDGSSLTVAQVDVLEALVALESISIRELAVELVVDPANLSRTVANLEELGLVERGHDTRDRRLTVVSATTRGRRAHDRIFRRRHEQLQQVLAPMDPDRRRNLAELLDEYLDLVERSKDDESSP
jgi:DNA-binding MarR family transcriptional regulator